ncbi:transcription antiterminator [Clostridium sp.]|uniref:BglG family transcription antiterminator n=1 Tax=Clostridium sp. TaxID=1506 RepID=UPI002587A7A8|nr:transcription antiterminator [Clostridium sp.]MDF2505667.1 putative domain protein/PTS system, L-ascorbate family, component [Clostridium sp.]
MINKRCIAMINYMLSEKVVKITDIADKLKVTDRTVRYDLIKIDDFLIKNGFLKLKRKAGVGIWIELEPKKINKLKHILNNVDTYDYVMTEQERIKYVIFILLGTDKFRTIDSLAEELFVSRGTIIKDVNHVEKWLENNKIQLLSIKAHGLKVKAEEKDIRKAVIRLFEDDPKEVELLRFINKNSIDEDGIRKSINEKLLKNIDLVFIKQCIVAAENQLNETFSDESFNALLIHVAIAILRIRQGKDINIDKFELLSLKNKEEYSVAAAMARMLESKFKVIVPEDEIGYITIHLLAGNVIKLKELDKDNWIKIRVMAFKLIENFQRDANIKLDEDEQLFNGLLQHLKPMIYRIKHNIILQNPLIDEIKQSFENTFYLAKKNVEFIEKEQSKKISEDEIGYITMHFQTAMDKINKDKCTKSILIVCVTGLGTAKFIENRIQNIFDVKVINTISSRELDIYIDEYEKKEINIDYIISSIPIKKEGFNVIQVDPFLSDKDIVDLSKYLSINKNKSIIENEVNISQHSKSDRILKAVEKSTIILDRDMLSKDIERAFNLERYSNDKPGLLEVLDKDSIELNRRANNWEEAVRLGGEILFNKGMV